MTSKIWIQILSKFNCKMARVGRHLPSGVQLSEAEFNEFFDIDAHEHAQDF